MLAENVNVVKINIMRPHFALRSLETTDRGNREIAVQYRDILKMNVIDHSLFPLHRISAKQRLDIKQLLLRLLDANVSVVNIVDMTAVRLVNGNRSSAHVPFILAVNDIIFFKQKIMNLGLQTVPISMAFPGSAFQMTL